MALPSSRGGRKILENRKPLVGPITFVQAKHFWDIFMCLYWQRAYHIAWYTENSSLTHIPLNLLSSLSNHFAFIAHAISLLQGETWLFECQILSEQLSFYVSETNVLKQNWKQSWGKGGNRLSPWNSATHQHMKARLFFCQNICLLLPWHGISNVIST